MNIKRAEYAFQNDSILFPFPGASQEMCKIPIVILLSLQPNYWCGGHPAFWASRLFWFGSRQLRGNWFLAWIGILIIISWLSEEMCVLLRWMSEMLDIPSSNREWNGRMKIELLGALEKTCKSYCVDQYSPFNEDATKRLKAFFL